jgi:hypothetical protein
LFAHFLQKIDVDILTVESIASAISVTIQKLALDLYVRSNDNGFRSTPLISATQLQLSVLSPQRSHPLVVSPLFLCVNVQPFDVTIDSKVLDALAEIRKLAASLRSMSSHIPDRQQHSHHVQPLSQHTVSIDDDSDDGLPQFFSCSMLVSTTARAVSNLPSRPLLTNEMLLFLHSLHNDQSRTDQLAENDLTAAPALAVLRWRFVEQRYIESLSIRLDFIPYVFKSKFHCNTFANTI